MVFGFFKKEVALNDADRKVCNPILVNQTNQSIVLFMDRGVLYNKQVLAPGEAVGMTRKDTAGTVVPYKIHAVVGDERSLPTRIQSAKNLLSTAVIPAAFIIGTLTAACSAGTMTGPASALGRAASGVVVKGMVIDSVALAAGSLSANRAAFIADKLIEKLPANFSAKSGLYMPGNRYVVIRGGIEEPLTISTVTAKEFKRIPITGDIKVPMDTLQEKLEYYTPAVLLRFSKKEENNEDSVPEQQQTQEHATLEAQQKLLQQRDQKMETLSEEEQIKLAIEESMKRSSFEVLPSTSPDQQQDQNNIADAAMSEEEQLRMAIEESLKVEEDRKKQQERHGQGLKDDKNKPVLY